MFKKVCKYYVCTAKYWNISDALFVQVPTYFFVQKQGGYHANNYFIFKSNYIIKIFGSSISILIFTLRRFWKPTNLKKTSSSSLLKKKVHIWIAFLRFWSPQKRCRLYLEQGTYLYLLFVAFEGGPLPTPLGRCCLWMVPYLFEVGLFLLVVCVMLPFDIFSSTSEKWPSFEDW